MGADMCGRYRLSRSKHVLAAHFCTEADDDWIPRSNIAPTQSILVIPSLR
jgi:putative SOS response-associated peptidase YedK